MPVDKAELDLEVAVTLMGLLNKVSTHVDAAALTMSGDMYIIRRDLASAKLEIGNTRELLRDLFPEQDLDCLLLKRLCKE